MGSPVIREKALAPPCWRDRRLHSALVRVSSHTMAFVSGLPVCLHHTTVVSRWLVTPTPRTVTSQAQAARALSRAPAIHDCRAGSQRVSNNPWRTTPQRTFTLSTISLGSCSTQLRSGKCVCEPGTRPAGGQQPVAALLANAPSLRHYLPVLLLVHRHRSQRGAVIQDDPSAGGALVD